MPRRRRDSRRDGPRSRRFNPSSIAGLPDSRYLRVLRELKEGAAPTTTYQEWFSWAVIDAIATSTGLVTTVPAKDVNKTDMQVQTWKMFEGKVRTVGLQLKSTLAPKFSADGAHVSMDLTYDDWAKLLMPGNVPRFLVVVAVPRRPHPLATLRGSTVQLGAAAWWSEVTGPGPQVGKGQRINVPISQRFDDRGLTEMLRAVP